MGRFARAAQRHCSHGSMTEGVESAVRPKRRSLRVHYHRQLRLPLQKRSPRDGARQKGRKGANAWIEMPYSIVPFGVNWRQRRHLMPPIQILYCETTRCHVPIHCCLERRNEGHVPLHVIRSDRSVETQVQLRLIILSYNGGETCMRRTIHK